MAQHEFCISLKLVIEAFHKQRSSFFNCPREIEESRPCCANREGDTEKSEITFTSSEDKVIASLGMDWES